MTIANTNPNTAITDRIEVAYGVFADITLAGFKITSEIFKWFR